LVLVLDGDGRISDYVEGDPALFAALPRLGVGKTVRHVFPAAFAGSIMEAHGRAAEGELVTSLQCNLPTKAGMRKFVVWSSQLKSSRILVHATDITDLREAEFAVHNRLMLLSSLYEYAQDFPASSDLHTLAKHMARTCVQQLFADQAWVGFIQETGDLEWLCSWPEESGEGLPKRPAPFEPKEIETTAKTRKYSVFAEDGARGIRASGLFPLVMQGRVIGFLGVASASEDFFSSVRAEFLGAYGLLAAAIMNHAQLYDDARQRLEQLDTLRRIDQDILSSFDLHSTAYPILKKTVKQLQIDAADILILNRKTQTLDYVGGIGFKLNTLHYTRLNLGESYAGQAALEKRLIYVENLNEDPQNFLRANHFREEGFHVYMGMPLISRGDVKGVLEVFQRGPLSPDRKWLRLLETISNQIGIAVDNALLLENLDRSNKELASAYNATIEGLSSALELRDHETEGHTRRVAEMTVRLAEKMGFPALELEILRQGALLHDIGKVGIPDSILLKPSALTADEWEIMKQHPIYASRVLEGIEHLRPAVDIPLYHHEKWDGSGYPKGLRADQIPLQARIFSVVDVYDALTSDRPYRSAWPTADALAYIRQQAGRHFDPKVVGTFLDLAPQFA
jgi:response regulator RpfG family c-di-GMP phosphodiesterase